MATDTASTYVWMMQSLLISCNFKRSLDFKSEIMRWLVLNHVYVEGSWLWANLILNSILIKSCCCLCKKKKGDMIKNFLSYIINIIILQRETIMVPGLLSSVKIKPPQHKKIILLLFSRIKFVLDETDFLCNRIWDNKTKQKNHNYFPPICLEPEIKSHPRPMICIQVQLPLLFFYVFLCI